MKNWTTTILLIISLTLSVIAQTTAPSVIVPTVGQPMPEFVLNKIDFIKAERLSYQNFKGKWLFMNFWFTGCPSCIRDIAQMDQLQKTFFDKASFLLVGVNEETMFFGKGIESLFRRLREKQDLSIGTAYDSILVRKWGIGSMPHVIIVDPEGIVHSITTGQDLTEEKIVLLLRGEAVTFTKKRSNRPPFTPDSITTNSKNLVYRSLLSVWNDEKSWLPDVDFYRTYSSSYKYPPGLLVTMAPLYKLYNLAYTGMPGWIKNDQLYDEVYPHPVVDASTDSIFKFNYNSGKGLYNYSLIVPPSLNDKKHIMKIMQRELANIFNLSASIEMRAMPVWNLVANLTAAKKLKTKGSDPYYSDPGGSGGAAGFELRNQSPALLLQLIMRYIDDGTKPFFDETGLESNIDITIDALMTDIDQIKAQLRANGLDLIEAKRTMKVIVINDAP